MRHSGKLCFILATIAVIAFGATTLAKNPNLPADCEPCGSDYSDDRNPEESCSSLFMPVLAYKANGRLVGMKINRCWACTTPGVWCTTERPAP